MAVLQYQGESVEVEDGSKIKLAAKRLGIPFGCENGECGTCMCRVKQGQQNLGPMTDAEESFGLEGDYVLACQRKVMSGTVVLDS